MLFKSTKTNGRYDTLSYELDFKKEMDDSSKFIILKCNLFAGNSKNLFTKDIRFTDINFGYPMSIILQQELEIPPGSTVELPEDRSVYTPDSDITALRNVERKDNLLIIRFNFISNTTFYPVSKYEILKKFYKEMHELLEEPITIKIK
jgi:hypothetical protein